MKSQCKSCTIAESECEYKKEPNRFFDGVQNVCSRDPRQKQQVAVKSLEDWQRLVERGVSRNGGQTLPDLNMSDEDKRKEWPSYSKELVDGADVSVADCEYEFQMPDEQRCISIPTNTRGYIVDSEGKWQEMKFDAPFKDFVEAINSPPKTLAGKLQLAEELLNAQKEPDYSRMDHYGDCVYCVDWKNGANAKPCRTCEHAWYSETEDNWRPK